VRALTHIALFLVAIRTGRILASARKRYDRCIAAWCGHGRRRRAPIRQLVPYFATRARRYERITVEAENEFFALMSDGMEAVDLACKYRV
jgi:hypothetical protein